MRDWSGAVITKQRADLSAFERVGMRGHRAWPVARKVDFSDRLGNRTRALGTGPQSAWATRSNFYIEQTVGALQDALLPPHI